MDKVSVKQARQYLAEAQSDQARKVWEDHIASQLKANGYLIDTIEAGDGQTFPKRGDTVRVKYVGTLASTGAQFDMSKDRPLDFKIGNGQVIRGWDAGIARMSLGEHAMLHVHSSWAYGKSGRGMIPGDADLDFEVWVVGINNRQAGGNNKNSTKAAPQSASEAKAPISLKRVEIPVSSGIKLEGLLRLRESGVKDHAILLTHPHPKLGGNMRNNVVSALAQALALEGYPTLALNFRGIGGSTGSSSWRGWEERQDVIAACKYLSTTYPKALIVGYSFGAAVACGVANEIDAVTGYVAVSYPCGFVSKMMLGYHFPLAKTSKPKLFIIGDADTFASVPVSREFVRSASKPSDIEVIVDGDHFWMEEESKVTEPVVRWVHHHTGHADEIRSSSDANGVKLHLPSEEKSFASSSSSSSSLYSSSSSSSSTSSSSTPSSSLYATPSLLDDPADSMDVPVSSLQGKQPQQTLFVGDEKTATQHEALTAVYGNDDHTTLTQPMSFSEHPQHSELESTSNETINNNSAVNDEPSVSQRTEASNESTISDVSTARQESTTSPDESTTNHEPLARNELTVSSESHRSELSNELPSNRFGITSTTENSIGPHLTTASEPVSAEHNLLLGSGTEATVNADHENAFRLQGVSAENLIDS